jgi:hypothetical protein
MVETDRCFREPILMVEAASTSETLVNFYQTTRRNNPEDSHVHTRRRENLKSHEISLLRTTTSSLLGTGLGGRITREKMGPRREADHSTSYTVKAEN